MQQDAGIRSCWSKDGSTLLILPFRQAFLESAFLPTGSITPFPCPCSSEQRSVAHTTHYTHPHSGLFEAQLPRLYHGQNEITWIVSL